MKKEIPILFSTAMVQAILQGRKTMTRRVMKPQITECDHASFSEAEWKDEPTNWVTSPMSDGEKDRWYCGLCGNGVSASNDYAGIKCPYGKLGDLLWVRETFTVLDYWEDSKAVQVMYEEGKTKICGLTDEEWSKFELWQDKEGKTPSLFMFKSMSRIWMEVTDIRVERLQSISEKDAKAEGAKDALNMDELKQLKGLDWTIPRPFLMHQFGFLSLWCQINGTKSWEANPWVWVVFFKVMSSTGKPEIQSNPLARSESGILMS